MNDVQWRHFRGDIVLWTVRWYCRYGISYRELEEILEEHGINVDHTTIYRWVQADAPEMQKRLRRHYQSRGFSGSWRVDAAYTRVKCKWAHHASVFRQ